MIKSKNSVFSVLLKVRKLIIQFICAKNVTKKLMIMYKNVTKKFYNKKCNVRLKSVKKYCIVFNIENEIKVDLCCHFTR